MFSMNGVDQRKVDLGLRPMPSFTSDQTTLTGRTQVDPSTLKDALVILFDGQSTNSGSVQTTSTPANASSIFNLSIAHKGACFLAKDPLLSSDLTMGHHGLYLADTIIGNGLESKIVLVNMIVGGNYFADHAPGGGVVGGAQPGARSGELAYRIGLTARCLANAGLISNRIVAIYQGGEWDSDPTGTTQTNCALAGNKIIGEYKNVGIVRPGNVMFINQCTRISSNSSDRNPIRAAQASLPDGNLVRLGFDCDTIGSGDRYDGTHMKASGAILQAAGNYAKVRDFILNG